MNINHRLQILESYPDIWICLSAPGYGTRIEKGDIAFKIEPCAYHEQFHIRTCGKDNREDGFDGAAVKSPHWQKNWRKINETY